MMVIDNKIEEEIKKLEIPEDIKRKLSKEFHEKIEKATNDKVEALAKELLKEIEPNSYDREGLKETPNRIARMYKEIYSGYSKDPKELLSKTFENEYWDENDIYKSGMVIVKDIDFYSTCEHHTVPFHGKAHIGYIPKKRVVGISKLARLTELFAKRLQIQERLTNQIADTINEVLDPLGVIVIMEAVHLCMAMRGVRNHSATTITSAVRGVFSKPEVRNEFLMLVKSN